MLRHGFHGPAEGELVSRVWREEQVPPGKPAQHLSPAPRFCRPRVDPGRAAGRAGPRGSHSHGIAGCTPPGRRAGATADRPPGHPAARDGTGQPAQGARRRPLRAACTWRGARGQWTARHDRRRLLPYLPGATCAARRRPGAGGATAETSDRAPGIRAAGTVVGTSSCGPASTGLRPARQRHRSEPWDRRGPGAGAHGARRRRPRARRDPGVPHHRPRMGLLLPGCRRTCHRHRRAHEPRRDRGPRNGHPCVINTREGSRRLRTGDRVRIDGSAGTVELLPKENPT